MAPSKTAKAVAGIKMKKVLPIPADDKMLAKKATELAKVTQAQFEMTEEKKAAATGFNHKIKALQKNINMLCREVNSRTQEKNVECTMVKNWNKNEVEYWYDGKVCETREMTADDRQQDIEDAKPKKKAKTIRRTAKVNGKAPKTNDNVVNI